MLLHVYNAADLLVEGDPVLDSLYKSIFQWSVFTISLITTFFLSFTNNDTLSYKKNSSLQNFAFLLAVIVILYFGLRTAFGVYIQDTRAYDWGWKLIDQNRGFNDISFDGDWMFGFLQLSFYKLGANFEVFMTFIASLYIIPLLIVANKILRNNYWIFLIFAITSFSFLGYGVNGIRNGVACHLVMLGIYFMTKKEIWNYILAALIFILSYSLHHSAIIPIVCCILAVLIIKTPKKAIIIWLIAIPLSMILSGFGEYLGEWIEDFSSEARLLKYSTMENSSFSEDGFRWDFLLYSSMPIIMTYYVTIKRNFIDNIYNIISTTYILSNAFWILLMRIPFNNRIAYLSWFLYPLVIAYPLLRFKLWENQDKGTSLILFLYSGFTFVMFLLGKA